MIVDLAGGGVSCQHAVHAIKITCILQVGGGDAEGSLRVDLQEARVWRRDVYVQDHRQIRRHHKTVITAGGKRRDQCVVIYRLSADFKLVAPQGDVRVFAVFPGGIFPARRGVGISRVQGDCIFGDLQGKGFPGTAEEHGDVPQGKVGVAVVVVIHGLHCACGASVCLYLTDSGNLICRVGMDRQHGTRQDHGQQEDIDLPQYCFWHRFHLMLPSIPKCISSGNDRQDCLEWRKRSLRSGSGWCPCG